MNRLAEKTAILLICMIALIITDYPAAPVAVLLVSASVSAAIQIFSGRKAALVLIAVTSLMCGIVPSMLCVLPVVFYDALCEKKWWLITPAVSYVVAGGSLQYLQLFITGVGMAVAFIMYRRIYTLDDAVQRLTLSRDDAAERSMSLAEQNMKLAAAQDNEIHIATLKERNRIARDIHDNVGHLLTRSILQTGAIRVINKDENLNEPLAELKDTLDAAMMNIRTSVHDLHDDSIDLKKAITDMTAAAKGRFDVRINYDAGGHIPGNVKLCVAGVVKEGISNAVKHSDGNRIEITFMEHPAFYQLQIEDNGSCHETGDGGIGLKNMEDRAAGVGGQITFTPSESGFRIFMTIPKAT